MPRKVEAADVGQFLQRLGGPADQPSRGKRGDVSEEDEPRDPYCEICGREKNNPRAKTCGPICSDILANPDAPRTPFELKIRTRAVRAAFRVAAELGLDDETKLALERALEVAIDKPAPLGAVLRAREAKAAKGYIARCPEERLW